MLIKYKSILAFLIVLLTFVSVNQWSEFPIGNTYTNWILCILIIITLLVVQKKYPVFINRKESLWVRLYLFWVIVCAIRGVFVGENYWDYKNLVSSSLGLLVVLSLRTFTNPEIVREVLRSWMRYALPLFAVFIMLISTDAYGFYIIPISLAALFFPVLPKTWKYILLLVTLVVVFSDLDARATVVKLSIPFLFSFLIWTPKFLNSSFIRVGFRVLFITPIILLILGLTNVFNIFQMDKYISGEYTQMKVINGEMREVSLLSDSRTFLYKEVVISAITNNYVIFGRTPARGNDSQSFGVEINEDLKTGRDERYSNEVSVMNIFTWTGLIGLTLYGLVFYQAAKLAILKSNNHFLKIVGIYISFRWCSAWVEDFNRFDIMNITLWMALAICYSVKFRSMSNSDFKAYIKTIFRNPIRQISLR